MIGWWYLLNTLAALLGSSTEPVTSEAEVNVCEIKRDPAAYLGRTVVIDAFLVDAEPHGIYVEDPNSPCILDIGTMAAGHDSEVFESLFFPPKADPVSEVKVRIHAVLKTKMRDDPFGRGPYRSYFLDQMKIIRLEP
jgi:hypothetical protein